MNPYCSFVNIHADQSLSEMWVQINGKAICCPLNDEGRELAVLLQRKYGGIGRDNRDRALVFADWVQEVAPGLAEQQAEAVAERIRHWSQF